MDDRRNPYLVLGVPYGASKDEARSAAARRSKDLRRNPGTRYSIEDVTWALHYVEQVAEDPSSAVTVFRVPAAPGILDAPGSDGLFRAPVLPLPRRSSALSDEEFQRIRSDAIHDVTRLVVRTLGPLVNCRPTDPTEGSS